MITSKDMNRNAILGSSCHRIASRLLLFLCLFVQSYSAYELIQSNTFTVSSFRYPQTEVGPFDLSYIRVDLPPWFSSVSVAIESDVELVSISSIMFMILTGLEEHIRGSEKPATSYLLQIWQPSNTRSLNSSLIQLAFGPFSKGSVREIQDPENVHCYPMQRNITLNLTNEQIPPGVWYLGLFNGIGPTGTQSKMIVRSPAYSFSANIDVEGCTTSTFWGQYCNLTIYQLSCSQPDSNNLADNTPNANLQITETQVSCKTSEAFCHEENEPRVYSLEVVDTVEQLTIAATNVRFSPPPSNSSFDASNYSLMYFVRHSAMPSRALHDYSGDLNKSPLVLHSPKLGRWFVSVLPTNLSKETGGTQNAETRVCYSIKWQMLDCPVGKARLNCTSLRHTLQTNLWTDNSPFESYYLPVSEKVSMDSTNFLLEPLSNHTLYGGKPDDSWTYFVLNIPQGAAGRNIHIHLTSNTKLKYEIYARFGGLPSLYNWDYYYANSSGNSDGSMFFLLYDSSEQEVDFYILYVKDGPWVFGLRSLNATNRTSFGETVMSVSVERCPKSCSYHGYCEDAFDASGLTVYSFCSCDETHGGFDCNIEIISPNEHIWQSIALIASNAAAILPAYWSFRKKAYAESVLFTSSGISSGLYHACDVGTWCALSFGVLQFMDFWLSFMAVVCTFVYLATISETSKRTIHTAVAILTALMAITNATRSSNIILVIAIGAIGLLVGLLIEFFTNSSSLRELRISMPNRWDNVKSCMKNLVQKILRRFRRGFVLLGLIALAMAAISWNLETSESYWIWHSLWHVSIYSSSFFFLCSKVDTEDTDRERQLDSNIS